MARLQGKLNELKHGLLAIRIAALTLACFSVAPATATTPVGHAADADSESAANMVYKVIKSKYSNQVSGRTLEISCSGRKTPFSCKWWIIKKSKERPKHCLTGTAKSIASSSGEGELHTRYGYVYKAGTASATYNAKKRSWVIVG
ncbi:MAG: hypothetical protein NTX07_08565 [Solirubrobacterales bacterium]|nr:hypothetical protein [Solirubrobacterales bacterium]